MLVLLISAKATCASIRDEKLSSSSKENTPSQSTPVRYDGSVNGIVHRHLPVPPSCSASRLTAGALGFLNLSHSWQRPEVYREPRRFTPILQACRKMASPSPSMCSLKCSPGRLPRSKLAKVALRVTIGSRRRTPKHWDSLAFLNAC